MIKHWRLAALPLCIGLLATNADAGIGGFGQFNSFQYTQVGPIVPLGLGEGSSITLSLTTEFQFSPVVGLPVSLVLTMTQGPGTLNVPVTIGTDLENSDLCAPGDTTVNCLFTEQMVFEPGVEITPGTVFGLQGQLFNNGFAFATAQDSFVASAPEPTALALVGLSVLAASASARGKRRA